MVVSMFTWSPRNRYNLYVILVLYCEMYSRTLLLTIGLGKSIQVEQPTWHKQRYYFNFEIGFERSMVELDTICIRIFNLIFSFYRWTLSIRILGLIILYLYQWYIENEYKKCNQHFPPLFVMLGQTCFEIFNGILELCFWYSWIINLSIRIFNWSLQSLSKHTI